MSRDIKYIGMDVHKEATVIAVLNGSGKLVMESIVETKASSILQLTSTPGSGWITRRGPPPRIWRKNGLISSSLHSVRVDLSR